MDPHEFDASDQHEEQFVAAIATLKDPRGHDKHKVDPLLGK
jgi:hypothetical protein